MLTKQQSRSKIAEKCLGVVALLGSKTLYSAANPDNFIIYNARVCDDSNNLIWKGDIDFTLSLVKLKKLSKKINGPIYAYYEGAEIRKVNAAVKVHSNLVMLNKKLKPLYGVYKDQIRWAPTRVYNKMIFTHELLLKQIDMYCTWAHMNPLVRMYRSVLCDLEEFSNESSEKYILQKLDYDKVYMHPDTYIELEVFYKAYLRNKKKQIPIRAAQEAAMTLLQIGPNVFQRPVPTWVRTGRLYLTSDYLRGQSDE